jgi:uncharacterized protein YjlB
VETLALWFHHYHSHAQELADVWLNELRKGVTV